MSDLIQLENNVTTVDVSPKLDTYTKVVINIDDETQVVAGKDTGLTLEFDNPFGSQSMANRILASLKNYRYSPYTASGAELDPAAEIGDAVQTTTSFGGIYTRSRNFGRLMKADISAPCDEEIDHEFKYEAPSERKFKRTVGDVRASITLTNSRIDLEVSERQGADSSLYSEFTQTAGEIRTDVSSIQSDVGEMKSTLKQHADEIEAKVSQSGSNESGSFSWKLTAKGHKWYANDNKTPVMSITASGLTVNGTVNAKSGEIGGFKIGENELTYNDLVWNSTNKKKGVYIGTSGIQLGKTFQVDNEGNIRASNLTLTGSVTFLDDFGLTAGTLSAADFYDAAETVIDYHQGWDDAHTSTTDGGYCFDGAGYGYGYGSAITYDTKSYPSYFTCGYLTAKSGFASYGAISAHGGLYLPSGNFLRSCYLGSITDHDGETQYVVKWS